MSVVTLQNTMTLALSVRDRHISADWYANNLGFEILFHADDAGWSELQTTTAGVTLGLGDHAEPSQGTTVPVFGVADITSARTALEAAGVKFDGPTETVDGMVSSATFYDPDGNKLMIAQNLTAQN